ncbi:MAG: hypothetical protein ACP5D6_10485 [Kosmotogaceae bacterium]
MIRTGIWIVGYFVVGVIILLIIDTLEKGDLIEEAIKTNGLSAFIMLLLYPVIVIMYIIFRLRREKYG